MRYIILFGAFLLSIQSLSSQSSTLTKIVVAYQEIQDQQKDIYKSSWPDFTSENSSQTLLAYKGLLKNILAIDHTDLNTQELINAELLELILRDKIDNRSYRSELMPLSAEGGFIISMIYNLQGKLLDDKESITQYKALLDDTPRYVNQQIALMRTGLAENKVMPKLVATNCLTLLKKIQSDGFAFMKLPLSSAEISDTEKVDFAQYIDGPIGDSFQRLEDFLSLEYIPQTRADVGVGLNQDGKSYYEQRVKYFTTLVMTPDEVFKLGKSEVARIKGEMKKIISDLNFDGSFSDFLEYLRTEKSFYAETPQDLLNHAAWLSMKAQEILPRYFTKLPSLPFTVKPVPDDIAPTYTTGRYSGGSFTGMRAGAYLVNTYNLPARPKYVLPSLTLHEAVPGHHLQISLAKELDLPKFRKNQYLSAFGEGWGLYAEYLGKEAGMYTTPYEDFGRLTYEMWRACRLVVDPGMHYFGWTREEAVQYMADNTSLSLHEVNTEIDRYIGWPGQAVSYKIGELKIRELREKAETELGSDFDLRAFHDLVLSNGSIPLSSLERIVIDYIETEKK